MAEALNLVAKLKIEAVDASALSEALGNEIKKSIPSGGDMSHPTSRVTESTAKLIGYEAIESPINRGMKGISDGIKMAIMEAMKATSMPTGTDAASEAKKAAVSGVSTAVEGLGSVLEIVLGEALDQIISIIQNIAKTLLMLSGIGVILKVISDMLAAFWKGFDGVGRVWGLILEMLGKMVSPFANLLIPLLLPFLYISSMVARTLNLILMPLYAGLMKAFSPGAGVMQVVMKDIMGGDLMGAMTAIWNDIAPKIEALGSTIADTLQPLFAMLAGWITNFLTMDLSGIKKTLEDLLGTQLGDAIFGMIDILYKGVSAISGFIAQLVGQKTFDSLFGAGKFDAIEKTNEAFKGGADFASTLQTLFSAIGTFAGMLLKGDFMDALKYAASLITVSISGVLLMIIDAAENFVASLIQANNPVLNNLMMAAISLAQAFLNIVLLTIPKLVDTLVQLAWQATMFIDSLKLAAATALSKVGLASEKDVWQAQIQGEIDYAAKPSEVTASSMYGPLAQTLWNVQGSLTQLSSDLSKGDVNQSLEDSAAAFNALKVGVVQVRDDILNSLIDAKTIPKFATSVSDVTTMLNSWYSDGKNFDPAAYMKSSIDALTSTAANTATTSTVNGNKELYIAPGYSGSFGDFIQRPGQSPSQFSPDDTIIGVKDLSKLGGKGNVTITNHYYITGYNDQSLIDKIKTTIEQHDANLSRSGYYNKGY